MDLELFGQPIPCLSLGQFIAALIVIITLMIVLVAILPTNIGIMANAAGNAISVFLVIWFISGFVLKCKGDKIEQMDNHDEND